MEIETSNSKQIYKKWLKNKHIPKWHLDWLCFFRCFSFFFVGIFDNDLIENVSKWLNQICNETGTFQSELASNWKNSIVQHSHEIYDWNASSLMLCYQNYAALFVHYYFHFFCVGASFFICFVSKTIGEKPEKWQTQSHAWRSYFKKGNDI